MENALGITGMGPWQDKLRPEGLITEFQYRLSDHLLYLELDTVWREDRTACGALEAVVIREDPSVNSAITLDVYQVATVVEGSDLT